MPVLGHAFVGLATAELTRPRGAANVRAAMWTPVLVTLAYLPDVCSQLAALVGLPGARVACHSFAFALITPILLAPILARVFATSLKKASLVVFVSLLVHDILDCLQATDRKLLWPMSDRPIGFDLDIVPVNSITEFLLFGGLFLAVTPILRRSRGPASDASVRRSGGVWAARLFVVAALIAASVTHYLRGQREREYDLVRGLMADRAYESALIVIDRADRWPSTAKPGRLDYARAEAHLMLGHRERAEAYYLASYATDPDYFWCVADLAVFYARSDEPRELRSREAAPFVERIRRDFNDHPDAARFLRKITDRLGEP